jgi:hypothetical protein
LFIRNFFLQAKWLTGITTRRFSNVWRSKSAENVQNDGETITGSFTMTMCQHTFLFQCSNFCLGRAWLWSPTLVTHLFLPLVISSCFREWNRS